MLGIWNIPKNVVPTMIAMVSRYGGRISEGYSTSVMKAIHQGFFECCSQLIQGAQLPWLRRRELGTVQTFRFLGRRQNTGSASNLWGYFRGRIGTGECGVVCDEQLTKDLVLKHVQNYPGPL